MLNPWTLISVEPVQMIHYELGIFRKNS